MKSSPMHLVRRALSSIRNSPLNSEEISLVKSVLNPQEMQLWLAMSPRDARHSLEVNRRFLNFFPRANSDEQAAALLHDVGKNASDLGWLMRVVATIVGSRGVRFTSYHNHVVIGEEMLKDVSSQRTIDLVAEKVNDEASQALLKADNI